MLDYRTQLLTLAKVYATATGRSESRVATIVQSKGTFFELLRSGRGCTVDTYLKVKRWFWDNWPESVSWPDGVHHPDLLPDAPERPHCNPAEATAPTPSPEGP